MSGRNTELDPAAEPLLRLMKEIVGKLPNDAASVAVLPPNCVEVRPARETAATFGVHCDCGVVDFYFGRWWLTFELEPTEPAEVERLVRKLADAIIAGNCEDWAGFLSLSGRIIIEPEPYGVTHFFHFKPAEWFRGTHKYDPYS